jgi:hypothetical protein
MRATNYTVRNLHLATGRLPAIGNAAITSPIAAFRHVVSSKSCKFTCKIAPNYIIRSRHLL